MLPSRNAFMKRIMTPLSQMEPISCVQRKRMYRLRSRKKLHASTTSVASAQVKSCVLLAGMYSDSITSVIRSFQKSSGDHAELLWRQCNRRGNNSIYQTGPIFTDVRSGSEIPSSAAYFIAAGLLFPTVRSENVGINLTRDGILRVCRAMGADITLLNEPIRG